MGSEPKATKKLGAFGVSFAPRFTLESLLLRLVTRACDLPYQTPYSYLRSHIEGSLDGYVEFLGELLTPKRIRSSLLPTYAPFARSGITAGPMVGGKWTTATEAVASFVRTISRTYVPFMVGIDHSATLGAVCGLLRSLSGDIVLTIFDAHLDLLPDVVRMQVCQWGAENGYMLLPPEMGLVSPALPICTEVYHSSVNAQNFLLHIIEQGLVLPQNILLIGVSEMFPSRKTAYMDPRLRQYHDFVASFQKQGVTIITKKDIKDRRLRGKLTKALHKVTARHVYVSLDVDVGSLKSVFCSRFLTAVGLSYRELSHAIRTTLSYFRTRGVYLAGADIMEIDIFKLPFVSAKDRTNDIIDTYITELIGLFEPQ